MFADGLEIYIISYICHWILLDWYLEGVNVAIGLHCVGILATMPLWTVLLWFVYEQRSGFPYKHTIVQW